MSDLSGGGPWWPAVQDIHTPQEVGGIQLHVVAKCGNLYVVLPELWIFQAEL